MQAYHWSYWRQKFGAEKKACSEVFARLHVKPLSLKKPKNTFQRPLNVAYNFC